MTGPSTIRTVRLELASLSPEFMEAVLAGDLSAASAQLGSPVPEAWGGDVREFGSGVVMLRYERPREPCG